MSNKTTFLISPEYSTNGSTNFSHFGSFRNPFEEPFFRTLLITAYVTVFGFCFFGNAVILVAIAKDKRLRSMTNFFLANLAVADFCVGTFCVLPTLSIFLYTNWILGQVMCKLYHFIWNFSYTASVSILTAIAIERYIVIIHPLKARELITKRKLKVTQMLIWIFSAIYNIPYLVFYDIRGFELEYCYLSPESTRHMPHLVLVTFVVWYLFPLALIGYMYGRICTVLWKTRVTDAMKLSSSSAESSLRSGSASIHSVLSGRKPFLEKCPTSDGESKNENIGVKSMCNHPVGYSAERNGIILYKKNAHILQFGDTEHNLPTVQIKFFADEGIHVVSKAPERRQYYGASSNEEIHYHPVRLPSTHGAVQARKRGIRLLIIIIVVFAVCVLPHHIRELAFYWFNWSLPLKLSASLVPVSFAVLYLNSGLNPILYALLSNQFRRSLKECFVFNCCRN